MTEISVKNAAKMLGLSACKLSAMLKSGVLVNELNITSYKTESGKNTRFLIYEECVENYIKNLKKEN